MPEVWSILYIIKCTRWPEVWSTLDSIKYTRWPEEWRTLDNTKKLDGQKYGVYYIV